MTTVRDIIKDNVRKQARVVIADEDLAQPAPAEAPAPAAAPAKPAAKKSGKAPARPKAKAKAAADAAPAAPAQMPWEAEDPRIQRPMTLRLTADLSAMIDYICDNTPRTTKHGFIMQAVRAAAEARAAEIQGARDAKPD